MEIKPEMSNVVVSSAPPKVKSKNQPKKKVKLIIEDDDNVEINNSFEIIIPIPDCFVSSYLKLSNGKNGHGERRLYTGDNNNNNEHICTKPWLINYPSNYKNEIESLLDDDEKFSKSCNDRKSIVYNAIDKCYKQLLYISPQNGREDVRRYYIGPDKNNKETLHKQLY